MTESTNVSSSPSPSSEPAVAAGGNGDQSKLLPVNEPGEVVKPKNKLKLVVDKQEMELDEDEVIKRAQKATYADQEIKKATQMRKQSEALITRLKTDPFGVLKDPSIGLDVKQLVAQYIEQEMEEHNLTPEQKELKELKKYKSERDEEANAVKKAETEKEITAESNRLQNEWNKEFNEILADKSLPQSPYVMDRVLHYMKVAMKMGKKNVSPKKVLPLVKEDFNRTQSGLIDESDDDTLFNMLGSDRIDRIVKAHLKRNTKVNTVPETGRQAVKPQIINKVGGKPQVKSSKQWMKDLEQLDKAKSGGKK